MYINYELCLSPSDQIDKLNNQIQRQQSKLQSQEETIMDQTSTSVSCDSFSIDRLRSIDVYVSNLWILVYLSVRHWSTWRPVSLVVWSCFHILFSHSGERLIVFQSRIYPSQPNSPITVGVLSRNRWKLRNSKYDDDQLVDSAFLWSCWCDGFVGWCSHILIVKLLFWTVLPSSLLNVLV